MDNVGLAAYVAQKVDAVLQGYWQLLHTSRVAEPSACVDRFHIAPRTCCRIRPHQYTLYTTGEKNKHMNIINTYVGLQL